MIQGLIRGVEGVVLRVTELIGKLSWRERKEKEEKLKKKRLLRIQQTPELKLTHPWIKIMAVRLERKREGGEAEEKEAAKDSTDSRIETDTSMDQNYGGKNEKVIEKADQECMEKPANTQMVETAEKAVEKQPAKQTGTENLCSSEIKPVDSDNSKVDVQAVAKQSMPADDDITPITSVPSV